MNEYMQMMRAAINDGKESFTYKGRKYVAHTTPSGLRTFKKA